MITVEMAERVHTLLVAEFGGATGLRDLGGLEAALARPYQTFGGQELIPTPEGKAAAMLEGILIRHPWLDGNKRTGYVLMELILLDAGKELRATEDEKYAMTIRVAEGKSSVEEIQAWIEAHLKKA
jgi:death-on-curing protein